MSHTVKFFHISSFMLMRSTTPIRLCHLVQANLHVSEKARENNVQFARRKYDASVDGHMQSMVPQL